MQNESDEEIHLPSKATTKNIVIYDEDDNKNILMKLTVTCLYTVKQGTTH